MVKSKRAASVGTGDGGDAKRQKKGDQKQNPTKKESAKGKGEKAAGEGGNGKEEKMSKAEKKAAKKARKAAPKEGAATPDEDIDVEPVNAALHKTVLAGTSAPSSHQSSPAPTTSKAKTAPTQPRLDEKTRTKLIQTGRAAYISLGKRETKNAISLFNNIPRFVAARNLLGIMRMVPSGTSFYAAVFDTPEHRDAAIATLTSVKFMGGEPPREVKLVVAPFGSQKRDATVVWTITAGPLHSRADVVQGLKAHFQLHYDASFKTRAQVGAKLQAEMETGAWMVRFENAPQGQFVKQIVVDGDSCLISQEPATICRFCNVTGHNPFDCPSGERYKVGPYEEFALQGGKADDEMEEA